MPNTSPMMAKFGGKKRPPKFEDDGPPVGDDQGRGSGSGPSNSEPDMDADDMGSDDSYGADSAMPGDDAGGGADPEEQAVDDLSDILGVGPEDRGDFGNALQAYVSACIAKSMAPDMGSPDMGGDMDVGGGPPTEEG